MTVATASAYLKTKVMTATPAELRLMLFDGALRFAEASRAAIDARDWEALYNNITRAQSIVLELMNALRPEHDPELCKKLSSLYTYVYMQLVNAGSQRNAKYLDEVIQLLRYERETWQLLLEKLAEENRAAAGGRVPDELPQADPPHDPALVPAPHSLIGGTVSVQG